MIDTAVGKDTHVSNNQPDREADSTTDTAAGRRLADALDPSVIDALLSDAAAAGMPIDGVDGLLNQMTKAVLERALQAEMTNHLGYERDDPAGHGTGNSRNGSATKTVSTTNRPVTITVPRDRNGEFEPQIVPKRARRLGQIDEVVLSCYARGMATRDIEAHLLEVYGVKASRELVSNITDVVADEIEIWRNRPVDEVYPIIYIDGIRIKVRDKGAVTIKVAHLVIGVDTDGRKHALGCWIAEAEGAKFWHSVLTQLRNRGLRDVLIACCDGLTGLPEAITTVFPDTVVQTCVVHVIRNAMRFVSYQDRKKIAKSMKTIYTAPTVEAAELALKDLDAEWGRQYPRRDRRMAPGLERIHPVPRLPGRTPPCRLHHQRHRIHQLPTPQNHQNPRTLPLRRRSHEAALPWTPQHLQQERRRIRNRNMGLENRPQHPRRPLPRKTSPVIA